MKNDLPSGRKIFNPLDAVQPPVQEETVEQVSTSAMSHDADDKCPKCGGIMQPAKATASIPVLFCDQCRVAHPMRA